MSDLESAMAALQEYDAGNPISVTEDATIETQEEIPEVIEQDPEESTEEVEEVESEDPPGLVKTYEEWIAAGKDPEKFKGKKAYEAEYKRIQSEKELKSQVKSLETTVKAIADAALEREAKIEARHRAELERALEDARNSGDIDAALEAKEQLHELNSVKKPPEPVIHPIISNFLAENTVLENSEINAEFERIYNGRLKRDGVGVNDQLSEAAIKGYLKSAMEGVKEIYPEKFSSPKMNRQAPVKTKPVSPSQIVDVEKQLRDYKIAGVGEINKEAAVEMYNMLKRDVGEEAAKSYAKSLLGRG